jgi:transcriptional regulator GlxA family with amidase domain
MMRRRPGGSLRSFERAIPTVRLDESHMLVKSGRLVTAGAALSHMDLALWLIRQQSPKLAAVTAKYLIVDSRPSQSAYALTDHLIHNDPLVERFERWARTRLAHGFSLDEAAKAVAASKRTLARRMQAVLGKSPLSYFQSLRVERAVHLLKTAMRVSIRLPRVSATLMASPCGRSCDVTWVMASGRFVGRINVRLKSSRIDA